MSNDNYNEQREKLLQLVRDALQEDQALRDKYNIGEKFRFIKDRLNALSAYVENNLPLISQPQRHGKVLLEDEIFVYIYLFNAQGLTFKTWQKMLQPSVLYEYSVNRPVYADKNEIEAFIRSKPNKAQHGFITIAVKKLDILKIPESAAKDAFGHQLVRVREGAFTFPNVVAFVQNGSEYAVEVTGELTKLS